MSFHQSRSCVAATAIVICVGTLAGSDLYAAQHRNENIPGSIDEQSAGARLLAKASEQSQARRSTRSERASKYGSKASKTRRSVLKTEKKYSYKTGKSANKDTVIDFDETDITGERRDPGVGFVKSAVTERSGQFVKIRKEWHDAMVKSVQLVD